MNFNTIACLIAASITANAFGQGVLPDNINNTGDRFAVTNGRLFMPEGSLFDGLNYNLGVTVTGGPSLASLQPVGLGTYKAFNDPKGYTGHDQGTFVLGTPGQPVNIPGVAPGGTAFLSLQIWIDGQSLNGLFPSFAAAVAGGGTTWSVVFSTPTGNPNSVPPIPPPSLFNMPSLAIPEPGVPALLGLGALSLAVLHRTRKPKPTRIT